MTTGTLIILDHGVALLAVVTWFAAAVTMALRRTGTAFVLLVAALLVTAGRVASVAFLAGRGWWFVQEKVLLGVPMLVAASAAAALLARPRPRAPSSGRGVVALFTAAYAAVAGFVLTFLVGYPLTLGGGLIAVALVAGAGLLTARVLSRPVEEQPGPAVLAEVSRRRFLGVAGGVAGGVVVAGAAGTGAGLSAWTGAEAGDLGGGRAHTSRSAVPVTDLTGPATPAPGGMRRTHTLVARKATVRLEAGPSVDAWTFGGTLPGPPITATQGDLIEVELANHDIDEGVTLHWHGYDVPCANDGAAGVTQEVVARGGRFVYRFRADQAGTYWYHTHHASHLGVRRGLYGTLVVKPRQEARPAGLDLTLPVHTFDGAVVLSGGAEHLAPAGSLVRLRLINTDSDPHRFALAGTPFTVAAVDGRDLHQPGQVSRKTLRLAAGGRHDLEFVMPGTPVSLSLDGGATLWVRPAAGATAATEDVSGWPELDLLTYGTATREPLRTAPAGRHFTLVLDRGLAMVDGAPAYAQTVNGRGHPSIPHQLVAEGDVVRFTVVNRSLETHPWHLHGHPVLVLSVDGRPSTGSPLWVDTFDVRPGEVWEVAFRAANPGVWMNHCHNLPHAHQGMMLQLRYDGVTTPFDGTHTAGTGHGH